jgi:outer membrane protein TolC
LKNPSAAIVLAVLWCSAASAQEPISLSLREAVRQAVEKNLDVRVELYNPAQSEADLRRARGIYDPHLTVVTNYQDSTTYSLATASASDQQTFKLNPGAYQLLPSGGTVTATFANTHTSTNAATSAYGSSWQSDLTLALNQPLLKNFGRDTTELNINLAVQGKEEAIQRYRNRILTTVAQVQSEYFKLYSLRQDLESRKSSLELARRILSDTKARVAAGVLPAMETLNAEFGVSSREKELIDAERAVRDEVDVLRVLVQVEPDRDIFPTDSPARAAMQVMETDAIAKALKNRPEFADLQAQVVAAQLQERVAKSRTRPDLNLTSSVSLTGAGSGYGRDLERVGSAQYPVWYVGLQLDYPLGNRVAEYDYQKSRLKVEQLQLQQASLRESVTNEVRAALRAAQSNFKQLDVSDRNRAYAEERLKAYIKKNEVGLATTKDLLDVENDLTAAKSTQINAQVAYSTAVIQLLKTTGELLEREGITISPAAADALVTVER